MINYDVKVGFSRVEINPPIGAHLEGYFHERKNEAILDDLEINTVRLYLGIQLYQLLQQH